MSNLVISREKDYWSNQFSHEFETSRFQYDHPKTENLPYQMEKIEFEFTNEINTRLREISIDSDIRILIILMTALKILLKSYSGNRDIIIGTPTYKNITSNNNLLAIRNLLNDEKSFKDTVIQVSKTLMAAQEYSNYPINELLKQLGLEEEEKFPLFDVVIIHESIQRREDVLIASPSLMFIFKDTNNKLSLTLEYNPLLYEDTTVERVVRHYQSLLMQTLFSTTMSLSQIQILSESEQQHILYEFNNTKKKYPLNSTIHSLFEDRVKKNTHSTALVFNEQRLTYGELNIKANKFAHLLRRMGVCPDQVVGVIMDNSIDMIVTLLGIIKAGGAYVPIDPETVENRMISILEDCKVNILVTHSPVLADRKYESLAIIKDQLTGSGIQNIEVSDKCTVDLIVIDKINEELQGESSENLLNLSTSTNLAYVIFTSGSTGRPKGVMIEHKSAINTLHWFGKISNLTVGTPVLLTYNYTSDPSVEDIFANLIFGSTLYITDKYLLIDKKRFREFVNENRIAILNFVPRIIEELLSNEPKLDSLDIVLSGGEELNDALKDELLEKGYTVFNNYGPTEATIDCLSEKCTSSRVTIGKPIDNMRCYILDENNNVQPIGVVGELCVSGVGIARGYMNRPDITSQKFVEDPFFKGERMYRTGDLAKWRADGSVQFFGRVDSQIKLNGYRIELGEIEWHLRENDSIRDAVVTLIQTDSENESLCAYIVPEVGFDKKQIREYLYRRLPRYMVPSYFVVIDKIPLNSIGKVNKSELPMPKYKKQKSQNMVYSSNDDISNKILELWLDVLEQNEIGLDDNFFESGATSMDMISLNKLINEFYNIEISVVSMFTYTTINSLAEHIVGVIDE
ncbi:amino acid adenylation domain-containing protein [Virgibacillus pantothenticus]|uniref:non-ribosomal peptide synthetase n=1 Tax=Virgibacillus pantothenticus TaxID=1473 RepID=UPI001C2114FA|nr:non-ribosomal peptide synthetase [Virgibacillus pantothenticus]MBU8567939.1 amino acid adenylation domain-containing protein [Virgibacillus pantothenticus]MBU8601804.1 amino acid adenylation domain-containing protein [Virgibacillus pantothenticus]MBU8635958.1 amino acid adenylation domain-containing protein [Virgibacillus pantothenticus]MBU8643642.1 amino acid adenylation domain-containing protein [Virgibacillus pantothenticus]MBU8647782.1 amino acid adenylation domain-containing protein [V